MGDDRDAGDERALVEQEASPPEGPVEAQAGRRQRGGGVEQGARHGIRRVDRTRDGHRVDEVGAERGADVDPHRAPGTDRGAHQPLTEPGHRSGATQEGGTQRLRCGAVRRVEHQQGADGHRHAPAVDGELEHVVGAGPVDPAAAWWAHAPHGRPVRRRLRCRCLARGWR